MEIFIGILTFVLLVCGVVAVFVQVIPTPLLSWIGVLVCFLFWDNGPIGGVALGIATGLTLLAHLFEFFGSYIGAKQFGATWRGGLGAFLGGILGMVTLLLLPVPGGIVVALVGLFVGPFVGTIIGELLGNRKLRDALKSGIGTVLGNLAAMLVKLGIALLLLAGFVVLTATHWLSA